ncbi:YoaK family protein [Lacticaseibacillus daqingensis]|uniref:YoaK family protein n=1 Tax=Lacticaseibacillus daqingensis TaxID=2486014 RepID=UPI000F772F7D|nr:YoaK family protein [Lacticaseibacillus daqingensis]
MTRTTHFESTAFGALLTAAAGGLDAYSYLVHGGVFAGLQTGNLILLGVQGGQGHWTAMSRYLLALAAFAAGTLIVRLVQRHRRFVHHRNHRRRAIIGYVLLLLGGVWALGPHVSDPLAVAGLSLAAAALLQEFRQLNGAPFTPLMMTGNLRTLTESLLDGWLFGDLPARTRAGRTAVIMLTFAVGAAGVAALVQWDARLALGLPASLLLIAGVVG